MAINPIPSINLQQIAAGTEAVSQTRQLRGDQTDAATITAQAFATQSALANESGEVHRTEETQETRDQEHHPERDTSRRQRRHQDEKQSQSFAVPDEDGELHIDIEC
jgi:hypothetical protein